MSTLRSRAIIHGTAAAPISVSSQDSQSTQESSTTESTTTSSHLKDSQDQDEDYGEYEPDTQTVGPEGPQINEFGKEVQSLLEDRHTVNMDMVIAEREHGGKATTSTATHGHNAPEPKTAHKVNHEPTLPPSTKPTDTYMDDGMDEDQAAEDNSFSSAGSITQSYRRVIVAESHPCDKEPTITYAEVAPLVNKGQASCGPCTASYTITARNFDPENPDHQCKLIADTEKHGRKKGFNRPIVIDISSSGNRNKTVKVCWADMEDFKTAKRIGFRIYWKGIPYSATTWGPALPLRSRVIKVHLSATESGTALADAFRGSTHKWLSITHLWTITTRPSDDSQPPRQTGIVVAIVEFKNDNKELPLDWFELALLVLWVWYSALANADIIFLQECFITEPITITDDHALSTILGTFYHSSYRAILTSDAGILFLTSAVQPTTAAHGPRWAYAEATIRPLGTGSAAITTIDLWSIHGPVTDLSFWDTEWPRARDLYHKSIDTIIGADWNSTPSPLRDSLTGTTCSCPWHLIAPSLIPLDVEDTYRYIFPEHRQYTRIVLNAAGRITSAKRIDSIWASRRLLPFSKHPRFTPTSSDHHAAAVSFSLNVAFAKEPNTHTHPWTLHPGIMNDLQFCNTILNTCAEIGPPPTNIRDNDRVVTWENYILRLRDVARTESTRVGKRLLSLRESVTTLEQEIKALFLPDPSEALKLPSLMSRLHKARQQVHTSSAIRTTNQKTLNVFRPSSWITTSLTKTGGSHTISRLRDNQGRTTTDPDSMRRIAYAFFADLYSIPPKHPSQDWCQARLLQASHTRFSLADINLLDAPFTKEELTSAIRASNPYSSPGPTGLGYSFLTLTLKTTGPHLLSLAEGMRHGQPLNVLLQTTLLHKKGDKADLANYRPISVSDTTIRTITRMAAQRLQTATGHALPWNQAAFMPGRRTSLISGTLQGIIDHFGQDRPHSILSQPQDLSNQTQPEQPTSFFLLLLDQQKAYDRVGHPWLWATLTTAGCPPSFLRLLQSLYSSPHLQVSINGHLTDLVPLRAGALQGDPLSCSLYNVSLQPLLDLLTDLNIGITVPGLGRTTYLAFADDVAILMPGGNQGITQWPKILEAIRIYETASGARLNRNKSGFVEISHPTHSSVENVSPRSAMLHAGFQELETYQDELTHLGHPVNTDPQGLPCPFAYGDRLHAVGTRIKNLEQANTDLILRTRLCNSVITPMLWHHSSTGGLPINSRSLITEATCKYLYLGDKPWFGTTVLSAPRHLGGLGLIHPDHMFTAQSMTFLSHNLLRTDNIGKWLREGLAWELHSRYKCSPAALLLPRSIFHKTLKRRETRAAGFWGRLLHALANTNLHLDSDWANLDTAALLELPWFLEGASPPLPSPWTADSYHTVANRGWITWSDILWKSSPTTRAQTFSPAWPLSPPGPPACQRNLVPRPGASADPKGPHMGLMFGSYWKSQPLKLRSRLQALSTGLFDDISDPTLQRPRTRDPHATHFPWHLVLPQSRQWHEVSTRLTRRDLGLATPVMPPWPSHLSTTVTTANWSRAWKELHECTLPSAGG
ncbi:hypothetical protein CF335_g6469 [Tilletia laevis]|nr:hypothetical protein CF335_g6469 [Tilletia laevis]